MFSFPYRENVSANRQMEKCGGDSIDIGLLPMLSHLYIKRYILESDYYLNLCITQGPSEDLRYWNIHTSCHWWNDNRGWLLTAVPRLRLVETRLWKMGAGSLSMSDSEDSSPGLIEIIGIGRDDTVAELQPLLLRSLPELLVTWSQRLWDEDILASGFYVVVSQSEYVSYAGFFTFFYTPCTTLYRFLTLSYVIFFTMTEKTLLSSLLLWFRSF